jgi:cysteinyl-tRNA synthetase
MHNGFVQMAGEKMAKSEGNVVTINELVRTENFGGRQWLGDVLRLAMLQTHYRQPINWTEKGLELADATLDDWLFVAAAAVDTKLSSRVLVALLDDLNTPRAIAEIHEIRSQVKRPGEGPAAIELGENLAALGFSSKRWNERERELEAEIMHQVGNIEQLIDARNVARKSKNFAEADRIRDELAKMGVVLHDNKDGTTTWEVAR